MRKLASIQEINSIRSIPNADTIEVATVLGWSVVIKKGEFVEGDMCIFVEIDSVLPPKPEFEFLAKSHYRVKTIRLKGQVSQGLCLPLGTLHELPIDENVIGYNATDYLGITKYDPPEISGPGMMAGLTKRPFPSYVPKTDEIRLQSAPALLNEIVGLQCYATEKLDGTSASFIIKDGEIDVCSRNLSKKDEKQCAYWDMARKYNIIETLKKNDNIAIQGEMVGLGIQKNKRKLKEVYFFVFDIYDIKRGEYYSFPEFRLFCKSNGLVTVPIMVESFCKKNTDLAYFECLSDVMNENGHLIEGIVVRPRVEKHSDVLGGRLSFKVINKNYLLKKEKKKK